MALGGMRKSAMLEKGSDHAESVNQNEGPLSVAATGHRTGEDGRKLADNGMAALERMMQVSGPCHRWHPREAEFSPVFYGK
jgi:hypothetical protein